jgi:hypothetical protein
MPKPRRWRKEPYYKIQIFNPTFQSWKDERGAFDTLEEARASLARSVGPSRARIMEVWRDSRQIIQEQ